MYLKRLELYGFKSFAERTTLEFMPGITTVIGPNGSGKSNISDAIRWVLGEQSMKSLRGSKSEDIIFAGTQNRKSLGYAECSIVFDNSDGKLPVEYEEVVVTRRLYRSGETGYYINKVPCRLKDILELFMDTGIGKDGYSIIGQGKIDEILSNKSEDRRRIFEEAAGIVKYRTRKEEAEKKLEQTKLNLLRVNDILLEIEAKIEPLKSQSEKAKKFLDLREELKGIEIGLFLYNIDNYKEKLLELTKNIDTYQEQLNSEEAKQNEMQKLKEKLKEEIENLNAQIEEMQNLGFESGKKIEQLNSDIKVAEERIQAGKQNGIRFSEEINELIQKLKDLEEEKKQKNDKKTNLFANKEKFEKELEEKEKELAIISEKLSSKEKEIEEKKLKVQNNTDIKYEKKNKIAEENSNIENLTKRKTNIENDISSTISELDSSRMTRTEISKVFSEIESKRNKSALLLEEITKRKEEADKKTKEHERKVQELNNLLQMKESRAKFLIETEREKEGYSKSVKVLLQESEKNSSLRDGMHGVLADLIDVPKEYETAVEMCLGQATQNIVTEDEDTAKKLVNYLRENKLGRASFLPITSIKGKKIDKLIKNALPGVIGVASDLVKCEKKYEQIVLNLLGRTVIVDNMDTGVILARQNQYSFRIVTLKGDIINSSGSITGGYVAPKTVSILGRKQEIQNLEQEVKKINADLKKTIEEKENYENSIQTVLEEAMSLEKQMAEMEINYATEKQRLVSVEENVTKLETRLTKLKQEKETLTSEIENANIIKESLNKEISGIDKENDELNTEISRFAENNKDNQEYIDDLKLDITNLKISVSSFDESESSIDEMVARINEDIKATNQSVENKRELKLKIAEDEKNLSNQIENLKNEIERINEEVTNSDTKMLELKDIRKEKLIKQEENENTQEKQRIAVADLKDQISKVEVRKSKIEVELEQVINKMWEDYEITPNNAVGYEKPQNISDTTKKVNRLRSDIRDLGSVNVDSIEEYKNTKERYDFMCEQRLDLENSSIKLRGMISELTSSMKEQFAEQFKVINKNFGAVFTELFGGGKAEIKLADEANILECGIDIEAQPPGKKLQNMMLLSGGEKALTAIAILFAILKINPAPFCVLDEIEAALDDVNVYRFADYLKNFSKNTQFLMITHRKGTMEAADTVYGITMEENGVSKLLSMKLK